MKHKQFFADIACRPRVFFATQYTMKFDWWIDFDRLVCRISEDAVARGSRHSLSRSKDAVFWLIRIGFLQADPEKGVRYNANFIHRKRQYE